MSEHCRLTSIRHPRQQLDSSEGYRGEALIITIGLLHDVGGWQVRSNAAPAEAALASADGPNRTAVGFARQRFDELPEGVQSIDPGMGDVFFLMIVTDHGPSQ